MKRKSIIIIGLIILIITAFLYTNKGFVRRAMNKTFIYFNLLNRNSPIPDNPINYVWGIDLSHHQKFINWETLIIKNKPHFIYFKASEGSTHKDTKYKEYSRKARISGIATGAYHFFSYQSTGIEQALNFIETAGIVNGDLFPVLDVEFRRNMPGRYWIINEIKAFCREIHREYGVNPIIYCECDFFYKYLRSDFENFKYWISDLYGEPNCSYVFWQYTDNGYVSGIGSIDKNLLNKNINISALKLKNYKNQE